MDSLQLAGGLKTTQRRDNRIEHGKQDQHAVLIRMHTSIASLIPIATDAVQLLQQSAQVIDVLQSENDFALDSIFAVLCHASIAEKKASKRKGTFFLSQTLTRIPETHALLNSIMSATDSCTQKYSDSDDWRPAARRGIKAIYQQRKK